MAANLEYQVVSKIIETQDFHSIERLRVDDDFFFSPECKTIFKYLWQHFHQAETFGYIPSFQIVQQIFPGFPYTPSSDNIDILVDQLRLAKMKVDLLEYAEKIQQFADYNPREGLTFLREASSTMSTRHEMTNDMLLSDVYDDLLNDYHLVASGKGITGLPWPWYPLNEATQGIHPGEFILIYGRPKNMKTWTALYIATILHLHCNVRVLIYSLEMHPKQILRRVAAIRAMVNYKSLLSGKLQQPDYYRFFEHLQSLKMDKVQAIQGVDSVKAGFMVTSGKGSNGISFLHSKIREFKPHIVFVDGLYLMQDDRQKKRTIDWKAIAHISQDMKITAREFEIPIIATAQANRGAAKTNPKDADVSEIAYSDALGQDTDFSIRVTKRMDEQNGNPELVLSFPGSRETDLDAFLINAIPALNFDLKSLHVTTKEEDSKKDPPEKKADKPPTIQASRLRGT